LVFAIARANETENGSCDEGSSFGSTDESGVVDLLTMTFVGMLQNIPVRLGTDRGWSAGFGPSHVGVPSHSNRCTRIETGRSSTAAALLALGIQLFPVLTPEPPMSVATYRSETLSLSETQTGSRLSRSLVAVSRRIR